MRDFNARDINGDVVINDNSTEYKQLIHCSNEELVDEENHRHKILRKERNRINKIQLKFLLFFVSLLGASALFYYIQAEINIVSTLLGFSGFIGTMFTLRESDTRSEFEQRQIDALDEINMILRERDVR